LFWNFSIYSSAFTPIAKSWQGLFKKFATPLLPLPKKRNTCDMRDGSAPPLLTGVHFQFEYLTGALCVNVLQRRGQFGEPKFKTAFEKAYRRAAAASERQ
jgi:hypothetical protein